MGSVVFGWGILGVLALLGQALWRLAPLTVDAVQAGLTPLQWGVMTIWIVVMAHAEGYRGFHRRFSPRVVARALWLREHPTGIKAIVAPLFCMSLFGATRKGMMVARILVVGILGLILLVRTLPQPWRGMIDAGVVVGLGIGVASIVGYAARALLSGTPPPIAPDLPEGEASGA